VRNFINGRHKVTKEPLNIFFIDLEPSSNNKEVYEINYIQNKAVVAEPPRKINGIIQCTRCQQYGHSKPPKHIATGHLHAPNAEAHIILLSVKNPEILPPDVPCATVIILPITQDANTIIAYSNQTTQIID
jgi:hypothetical protein